MSDGKNFLLIFFIKVISRKTKLLENYFVQKLFQSIIIIKKKCSQIILVYYFGGDLIFFIKNFMGIPVTIVWE